MTFSVSAPTNNTGALLNNGTEVLSIDSSNNVVVPENNVGIGVSSIPDSNFAGVGNASPVVLNSGEYHFNGDNRYIRWNGYFDSGNKYYQNGYGAAIGLDNNGSLAMYTAGNNTGGAGAAQVFNNRLNISPEGYVTKANMPAFFAYMNTNYNFSSFSTNQLVPFNTISYNNGNHFNTSTYIFTAPVTGYYQINLYLRVDNVESTPSNYFHPILSINDSESYGGNMRLIMSSSTSQIYESVTDSQVFYLAANDTVRVKHGDSQASGANGGSALYNGSQCRFSGYLIG